MPNIKDNSTVEAIARAFCSNGRDKHKALLEVGYKESYARSKGMLLYEDKRVMDAIERTDAKAVRSSKLTIAEVLSDLAYGLEQAKLRDPPDLNAIARFSELRGKYLAMYTDKLQTDNTEQPTAITAEEAEQLRSVAQGLTKLRLKQG